MRNTRILVWAALVAPIAFQSAATDEGLPSAAARAIGTRAQHRTPTSEPGHRLPVEGIRFPSTWRQHTEWRRTAGEPVPRDTGGFDLPYEAVSEGELELAPEWMHSWLRAWEEDGNQYLSWEDVPRDARLLLRWEPTIGTLSYENGQYLGALDRVSTSIVGLMVDPHHDCAAGSADEHSRTDDTGLKGFRHWVAERVEGLERGDAVGTGYLTVHPDGSTLFEAVGPPHEAEKDDASDLAIARTPTGVIWLWYEGAK